MARRGTTWKVPVKETLEAEAKVAGVAPAAAVEAEPAANGGQGPVQRKRGRPSKNPPFEDPKSPLVRSGEALDKGSDPCKAALTAPAHDVSSPQPKRQRGRPLKGLLSEDNKSLHLRSSEALGRSSGPSKEAPAASAHDASSPQPKRKQGRPTKHPSPEGPNSSHVRRSQATGRSSKPGPRKAAAAAAPANGTSSPEPKRQRGRPPKHPNKLTLAVPQPAPEAPLAKDIPSRPKRERRSPVPSCFAAASQDTQSQSQQQQQQKRRKKPQASASGSGGQVQHKDYVYRQAVRRVAAQLQRISQEEHLIQSYAADGWKGASREKVRLTDEIERAEQQVLRCQVAIREAVRFCEEAQGDRAIPQEAYDSEGEVDASDIFCGRCHEMESYDDNDIVMCDGPCNRAYHEACLSPRLVAAELPEDEGWLCPACDAKADIINQLNSYFGTDYGIEVRSEELFSEPAEEVPARALKRMRSGSLEAPLAGAAAAAAGAGGGHGVAALLGGDLPSEDEMDATYTSEGECAEDDEEQEACNDKHRTEPCHREQGGSNGSSSDNDTGDEGEDEDMLGSEVSEEDVQLSGASSGDEEEHHSSRRGRPRRLLQPLGKAAGEGAAGNDSIKQGSKKAATRVAEKEHSAEKCEEAAGEALVLTGKRPRAKVDYCALHQQMFGVGAEAGADADNSDEDYEGE